MGTSILITQCLQNDFVKPIGEYEPLPNLLHIGATESRRLVGDNPSEGPVARLMRWAYSVTDQRVRVIHIRDWHDENDPSQRSHLEQFGAHCIRDTEGADFAFDVSAPEQKDVPVISTSTLNDFSDTALADVLDRYRGGQVRVGITGVWTEAKVTFLSYELRTRYPDYQLSVCSALTASSSRARHFRALEQLESLLGVRVFTSMGEFVRYLGGETSEVPLSGFRADRPRIDLGRASELEPEDATLVRYLFRDCREVRLKTLDGGFSGNVVLGSESVDEEGHPQAPHVVKIGPSEAMGKERVAFERVEAVLGNVAPRITDFADHAGRGALRYRYASMGGGTKTFQKLYMNGLPMNRVETILTTVFGEQLGRLYRAARRERCDLLEYYGFDARWTSSVHRKVEHLVGSKVRDAWFEVASRRAPNVCRFYENLDALPRNPGDSSFFAFVHGDLNGANIIIDEQGNVWLIDFFHTHRGHVLKDLIKLENDLLFIFTDIASEDELSEGVDLIDRLMEVDDLERPIPKATRFRSEKLRRAWETITILRSFYPELVRSDRDPLQFFIAQTRYAVHTLGFDESSPLQKIWALYTAGHASEQIKRRQRHRSRLRVDWIEPKLTSPGRLGLTLLPGRGDYGRSLEKDIAALVDEGVSAVLCLVPDDELDRFGVGSLLHSYSKRGLTVRQLPIVDQGVSSQDEMNRVVDWLKTLTDSGRRALVHCVGGLGRSGLVAACYLKATGMSTDESIAAVRTARSPRAIESSQQEAFVESYGYRYESSPV